MNTLELERKNKKSGLNNSKTRAAKVKAYGKYTKADKVRDHEKYTEADKEVKK